MKCAAYAATRNLYDKLLPSLKSLLANSDVEKVYLLIEDDKFPVELPQEVECINVSNQKYFRNMSPNNVYPWAYMCMMRAALYKVLPDVDVVLSLDVDTIVDGDISGIWDLVGDNYMAAVPEPSRSDDKHTYFNAGVVVYNLEKMRDGMGDRVLKALNWQRHVFLEQDCLNELCRGKIRAIPSAYNACQFTKASENPKIVHYARLPNWFNHPLVQKYNEMAFDELRQPSKRGRKRVVRDD